MLHLSSSSGWGFISLASKIFHFHRHVPAAHHTPDAWPFQIALHTASQLHLNLFNSARNLNLGELRAGHYLGSIGSSSSSTNDGPTHLKYSLRDDVLLNVKARLDLSRSRE